MIVCFPANDKTTIGGLIDTVTGFIAAAIVNFQPDAVSIGINFNDNNVFTAPRHISVTGHDVTTIEGAGNIIGQGIPVVSVEICPQ